MATVLIVRAYEVLCVGLWLAGLIWVWRQRRPVYSGVYFGSSTLMVFDWVFNTKWFFRVLYAEPFIPLWSIDGVTQPVALAANYAFFFGAPVLMLVHRREWLDRHLGRWVYAAIFAFGAVLDVAFEIPMVQLGLWTYYQREEFLLWSLKHNGLLDRLQVPALLINGKKDHLSPIGELYLALESGPPTGRVARVYADDGHIAARSEREWGPATWVWMREQLLAGGTAGDG